MVPARLIPLFRAILDAGGRALVIGGAVRDHLRGEPSKDFDIEVHDLDADALAAVLRRFGRVDEVGRSFGVLKLRMGGQDLDVSLPRRDSRAGSGHRGIRAQSDPHMDVVEAARRRDLTINAIAWDPISGAFVDPFDGRDDLANGVLRAVDPATFGEDPLRALRVAQFAARFGFRVDATLESLCADMPLAELPAERIRGEVEKLLLKGTVPSVGWEFARRTRIWAKVLPTWDVPAPAHLDRLASDPVRRQIPELPRRFALMLACACGGQPLDALDRMHIHRWERYPVRDAVLFLSREAGESSPSENRVVRLADEGDLELLAVLRDDAALAAAATKLGVLRAPLPPLLQGRDLMTLGLPPGPEMGRVLGELRELQFEGRITTVHDALAWARTRL